MKKLIMIGILTFLFMLNSCQKDTTGISNNLPDTTSHNFVWTADTLYAPDAWQISLYDIWGTDENNVWAVGHSDLNRYRIWHYNGEKWNNVSVAPIWHVPTYYEIFGFSENDFWIVGDGGKAHLDSAVGYILHYDGSWNRVDNWDLPPVAAVWGTSSDNMYFGCHFGVIARYDGTEFTKYKVENDVHFRCIWGLNDSTIYALANKIVYKPNLTLSIGMFYKIQNNIIVLIDSAAFYDKGFGMDLWGYDENNFYSGSGKGVFKYINEKWENEFYSTTIYSVYGSAPNNVFAGGFLSTFYHYNGDNWKALNFGDNLIDTIYGIWCKENYLFVIQHLGYYSRILRGTQIKQ